MSFSVGKAELKCFQNQVLRRSEVVPEDTTDVVSL